MTRTLTPVEEARVETVAQELLGTCQELHDATTEEERDDIAFLTALDHEVMRCESCCWWCESHEMYEDGNCEDCHE